MKKRRQMCVLCVILFTLLVVSTSSVSGEEWKQQDFIDLWNKVRTAVVENDLEEFKKLTVPTDPEEAEQITKEDFAEFVEYFLIDTFPEWSTVKLLKFEQNAKEAILVLHLHDDNEEWKEWVALYAYRFMLTENGWKISGDFYESSFGKIEDADENQQRIEEELKKPEFQLGSQE